MSDLSEADRYLLEQIQQGDSAGWSQLVERYQGRLLAFARKQLNSTEGAEDAVQETFLSFLRGINQYRRQASLETWLFAILRRRLVDVFRKARCADALEAEVPSGDPSASWYARRREDTHRQEDALRAAVVELTERFRSALNFRDLMICEMIFYAQLPNREIAGRLGMKEPHVAVLKHRFLQRVSEVVHRGTGTSAASGEPAADFDTLLTRVWEDQRPSCPKRSTIGRYLLGTLDPDWTDYVRFHLDVLACQPCQANRDDLNEQTQHASAERLRNQVLASTVGFLSRQRRPSQS